MSASDEEKYGRIELAISHSPVRALLPFAVRSAIAAFFGSLVWLVFSESERGWNSTSWILLTVVGIPALLACSYVVALLPVFSWRPVFLLTEHGFVDCSEGVLLPWWCIRSASSRQESQNIIDIGDEVIRLSYEGDDGEVHSEELTVCALELTAREIVAAIMSRAKEQN